MKTATPTDAIDVQALRVGMFVHLDVAWMAHPFPLSSFRITSPEQVATIRSLGLRRVRWSPQQSVVDAAGASGDGDDDDGGLAIGAPARPLGPVTTDAANDSQSADEDSLETVPYALGAPATPAATTDTSEPAQGRGRAARSRQLARQSRADRLCERQYAEAASACRQTFDLVPTRPKEARAQAEALTHALVAKMVGEQDLCIRMLVGGAGEKASLHAMNVGIIALLMGRCFGFEAGDLHDLGVGALLHDVGKLDLPARLRHREDNFSAGETRCHEEHVQLGVAQARRLGLSPGATTVIAQHHEHADGSGFPAGLNSDRMTVGARIVALVNRYDDLCNPHLLARALTPHEALSLLFARGRSKFDTAILAAFIKMMGVYPPGSTVQLTDDRYALVVAVNSSRPLKPNVIIHDAGVARADALVVDLETVPGLGIRRSIRAQQLPPPALEFLAPSARVAYFFEPSVQADDDDE